MDFISTIAGGGITGLLGTAISGGLAFVKARQRHEQELEMRKLDLDEMRLEAETAQKRAAIDLEVRQAEADARVAEASYRDASTPWTKGQILTAKQMWPMVVVDLVRGLMRPALTLLSLGMLYKVWSGDAKSEADVSNAVVYIATTSTLWWFGTRQIEKYIRRG